MNTKELQKIKNTRELQKIKYAFARICGLSRDSASIIKTWKNSQIINYLHANIKRVKDDHRTKKSNN